jgi:hypothetical protein
VLFWVRDNGPGFDMRYHDRIFEIFQRLHRAEDFPGTGVGLAIVRKAVERMHGKVWAESAKGDGATFYIQLPAAAGCRTRDLMPLSHASRFKLGRCKCRVKALHFAMLGGWKIVARSCSSKTTRWMST